jgi:sec-independent protein translocase protein TatC
MARDPEEVRPEESLEEDEDGGGPVKTFLEHLEDLRWTLIRSVASIIIAMIVCLVAGNRLVSLLTWPLDRALFFAPVTNQVVEVQLGTNVLSRVPAESLSGLPWETNALIAVRLVWMAEGTNVTIHLQPEYRPEAAHPIARGVVLKNYSPIGGFIVAIKLALYGGLVLAAPFVLFFVGQFVLPALKVREKRFVYQAIAMGAGLFILGIAFCYFIIMQVALMATVSFSQWMGFGADEWRAEDYISFVCKFMLGMGISFQLPVVLLTLVKIGLLDYHKLSKFRSYWVVINLMISAFVTPSGDPFTMVLMALPLQILYEISVFISWIWYRREQAAQATTPD